MAPPTPPIVPATLPAVGPTSTDLLRSTRPLDLSGGDLTGEDEGWRHFAAGMTAADQRMADLDAELERATPGLLRRALLARSSPPARRR